jgi:hypothetical protein
MVDDPISFGLVKRLHRVRVGKTTFFVANQANIDVMPAEELVALEAEYKVIDEDNKARAAELKMLSTGKLLRALVYAAKSCFRHI